MCNRIIVVVVLLAPMVAGAQTVIPQTIPCVTIIPATLPVVGNTVNGTDCVESFGDVTFPADESYSIKGGEYVYFGPNTIIAPDATNDFHAYIDNGGMDVAWYYPNSTPGSVGQFEKLELGVQLNADITTRVNNFNNDVPGLQLNPFNPEEVDLYAEFWYLYDGAWYGPQKINGFYYDDFERGTTDWIQQPNAHQFRIRFAPRSIGLWRCKITANVAGFGTFVASDFTFNCVDSDSKDFVSVGANGRYFRMGDEPFFPVGHNMHAGNAFAPNLPDNYLAFHDQMDILKNSGGNYFRYLVSPWNTEIEFEELNDYSGRMSNAWEMDEILSKAESLDLKIHFDMQIHYAFEKPSFYEMYYWDWPKFGDSLNTNAVCVAANDSGYCYRSDLNLADPFLFFTDSMAMVNYKRRIRYMVARWGYSNEIAILELLSEINNGGNLQDTQLTAGQCESGINLYSPYKDNPVVACPAFYQWQHEMCRYIKEDLQHTNHPLTVSYAGAPNINHGDNTYDSEFVDIMNYNYYGNLVAKTETTHEAVQYYHTTFGKPFIFSEYGAGDNTADCDQGVDFIKTLVLTPFTGVAGASMNWDWQYPGQEFLWHHMGPVDQIMQGIPLDQENWQVGEPLVTADKEVEAFYLIGPELPDGQHKVVGVISNRTYNYYTQGVMLPCTNADADLLDNLIYQTPTSYPYSGLSSALEIPGMGILKNYNINWYDALTGNLWQTTAEVSDISEYLDLTYPGVLTGSNAGPILFFEIYPVGSVFKLFVLDSTIQQSVCTLSIDSQIEEVEPTFWPSPIPSDTLYSLEEKCSFNIQPNPTTNVVNIRLSEETNDIVSWTLMDESGRLLKEGEVYETNFTIDLNVYSIGVYIIYLQINEKKHVQRVVKI